MASVAHTDAALHRQRGGHKIQAIAPRQPGAADQVEGFHPGSGTHRAPNGPNRAKTNFTAQKRADHKSNAQKHVRLPRIALGSQGIRVAPADWPTPSSGERRRLLPDALRLTLWQATGSTGAWLTPQGVSHKRANCGV